MSDRPRFFLTTAIDYPNAKPHIGTAFEKLGADVQARYRRMEGYEVFFLMGNDENTVKVAKRAIELGKDPKAYCDEMAGNFKEVWAALNISFDDFIQTTELRHHRCCQKFIRKVYDRGFIYKGEYAGLYCEGCEAFKTSRDLTPAGECPLHPGKPVSNRSEAGYYFKLSAFGERLLALYDSNPEFIQPESRRNEIISLISTEGLQDVLISRKGETWGIPIPFDPEYTIYVWFDALLNYITAIGYEDDAERFAKWWPADLHIIGKDITRFHCALWPAMLMAAELPPPKRVFGHGFVQLRNEATGEVQKIGKSMGNVIEPIDIITQFSAEAFRLYFLKECPFPSDGEFSWIRFREKYNNDLANKLGNHYSRIVKLVSDYFDAGFPGSGGQSPAAIPGSPNLPEFVARYRTAVESLEYDVALRSLWEDLLGPVNKYLDDNAPWKLVKTDKEAALPVLFAALAPLRVAAILLKPFLPAGAETIYESFSFDIPWSEIRFEHALETVMSEVDLRILAPLIEGKVKPLYPRIAG